MGKQNKPSPAIEPIPLLQWNDFFWEGTIQLPAWKGFQCRLGPYASRRSRKPSDGTTRLSVTPPGKNSQAPPSSEQAAAFRYLLEHQKSIQDSILSRVFDEYPGYRAEYYDAYDLDESDSTLPELDRPEQLREFIGLSSVLIHAVVHEGVAYTGYGFGCVWEKEHGLGTMIRRERVVAIDGDDAAILEWIAEQDASAARRKK
jgi:hypothetical protein